MEYRKRTPTCTLSNLPMMTVEATRITQYHLANAKKTRGGIPHRLKGKNHVLEHVYGYSFMGN